MSILGKIGSKGANEIIDFAERLMAKEAPKKAAERREAIKSSAEAEDIIINKINSDPNAMDDMPMSILENLSVKNKAKIGLADEYSAEIVESTGGMLKEMSPKEAAENLLAFEDDEIFDYMSTLNARDLRIFKDNLSDDDFEAFGGYMPDLGPREKYVVGALVKGAAKLGQKVSKKLDEMQGVDSKTPGRTSEDRGVVVGKERTKAYKKTEQIKGAAKGAGVTGLLSAGASKSWNEENEDKPETKKEASDFEKAFSKAHNAGEETFVFKGKEYTTEVRKGKAEGGEIDSFRMLYEAFKKEMAAAKDEKEKAAIQERFQAQTQNVDEETKREVYKSMDRKRKADGGSMLVPPEMEAMPVDTYTPEEQANASKEQLPDPEMEEKYMGFIFDESLQSEEQEYLMSALESDPKLSDIFDKVLMTASEFSGSGKVEGPGTGVSDSIPARLSDGEFVITEKATSMLGADNLQKMMDDAERMADGGRATRQAGGLLESNIKLEEEEQKPTYNAIQKSMLYANQSPSLRGSRVI